MPFKSIRFKIVLWYMLILFATLLIFGVALYHNFSHKLKRDMDDLLRSRAQGISESIDTYWETERLGTAAPADAFSKQGNINFNKIAQRWVGEKTADPGLMDFSIFIFDAYGRPVAASKNIPMATLSQDMFKDVFKGSSRFDDWKIELAPGRQVVLRTFTIPIVEKHRLAYVVQVASPLTAMHAALHNLILLLFVLLPLTVVATAVAGVFLAKIALNPVHKMIETIHQITAENLKLRISLPAGKDEIRDLAVTFNEMIARLDHAFSSQRQFMQDISHELKTPLAVLKGELEVTLKKARSAAEYETTLASNLEEVNRLVRIVENLLTLARFDTKTIALEQETFELNALVQSAVDDIRVLAQQKGVALDFEPAASLSLNADRSQVRRLMLNLLDNAVKYTPANGQVTVRLWKDTPYVKIEVCDTGMGIPDADLPHIFDRFYRVEKSRSGSGFGLGLSIAKSIVEAHQGHIDARAALHQGSSFVASFPSP